jgi:CheY-like chemotaxis protein
MPKTILVADDEKGQLNLLEIALKSRGYAVITASNGREALRLVHNLKPDLVLLDVQMPEMDGDTVAMEIRAEHSAVKDVPIIFITGLRTEQEIKEDNEENIFAKPVELNQLFEKIKSLIG